MAIPGLNPSSFQGLCQGVLGVCSLFGGKHGLEGSEGQGPTPRNRAGFEHTSWF